MEPNNDNQTEGNEPKNEPFVGGVDESRGVNEPGVVDSGAAVTPPEMEMPDEPKKKKRLNKKVLNIILFILLLIGGAVAAYFFVFSDSEENNSSVNNSQASSEPLYVVHNLAGINDVAEFGGYSWAALDSGVVKYNDEMAQMYDSRHGIFDNESMQLVIHDDKLWVATRSSVTVYDAENDKFKSYFTEQAGWYGEGIANVFLFVNPLNNQLSVSTFDQFYVYENEIDDFTASVGPIDTENFFFNENTGVALSSEPFTSDTVWEFEANGEDGWIAVLSLDSYSEQSTYLALVNDRFLVFGRSVDYESCGDKGIAAATLFNEYKKGGELELVDELNDQFFDLELGQWVGTEDYTAGTSSCEDDSFKGYNFEVQSGKFVAVEVEGASNDTASKPAPYGDVLNKLKTLFGREAFYSPAGVDGNGNLIALYTDGVLPEGQGYGSSTGSPSDSLMRDLNLDRVASVSDKKFGSANSLGQVPAEDLGYIKVAVCPGGSVYVASVQSDDYLGEIVNAKLYKSNNGSLEQIADLRNDITRDVSVVTCTDSLVYVLTGNAVLSVNRENNEVKEINNFGNGEYIGYVNQNAETSWYTAQDKSAATVIKVNHADGDREEVSLEKSTDGDSTYIVDIDDEYLWVMDSEDAVIRAYSHDGAVVAEFEANSDSWTAVGVSIGNGKLLFAEYGQWSDIGGIVLVDAKNKTDQKLDFALPSFNEFSNLVFVPQTNSVWARSTAVTYEIPLP